MSEAKFNLPRQVDSRNARFNKRMIYFSLSRARDLRHFEQRAEELAEAAGSRRDRERLKKRRR